MKSLMTVSTLWCVCMASMVSAPECSGSLQVCNSYYIENIYIYIYIHIFSFQCLIGINDIIVSQSMSTKLKYQLLNTQCVVSEY